MWFATERRLLIANIAMSEQVIISYPNKDDNRQRNLLKLCLPSPLWLSIVVPCNVLTVLLISIAARHGLAVQVLSGLREGSFGSWEGMSRAEVLARSPEDQQLLLAWERDPGLAPPSGESLAMVCERALATVEQLAQVHAQQAIVLVSHVVVIKALLCTALGVPLTSSSRIFLDPATISVIDWHPLYPLLRLLNSHAHLGWNHARWMSS